MANVQQITREYVLRARTEGVAETTAATQRLGVSQDALAVSVSTQSKSSLSAAAALERHQRSLDQAYRSTQQFAAVQRDLERAQQQGLISSARQAELMAIASNRYQQGSTTSKALEKSLSGVSGQLIALSAGAGPVGVFLSALGPWGVAAAVGIGGLAAAFNLAKEGAERMGEKAIALRQFMEVTGLTVDQFGALKHAAADLGFGTDDVTRIMQRLTANMNDTRRASGGLFEDVRKLGGGLSDQLRSAKTETEFINALAQAYKSAGDQASRAEIAKAVGGRGGIGAAGAILGAVGDAGGLDALAGKTKGLLGVTKEQVDELAKMKARIDELRKNTANIWDSLASKESLEILLQYEQRMNGIAKAAKQLSDQSEGLSTWQKIWKSLVSHGDRDPTSEFNKGWAEIARSKPQGTISQDFGELNKQETQTNDLAAGLERLAERYRRLMDPAVGATKSLREMQEAAAGDAKIERERIGVLGSAATIEEQRKARILDINSALLDNKVSQQDANRAISAANLDAVIQAESRRVSVLGNLASVGEQVKLQQDQINKSRMEGVRISAQEEADILTRVRIQAEQAKPEGQLATERELLLLSQEEAQIRQKLIGWGIDYNSARGKALTLEMREIDLLKQIKSLTEDFVGSFVQGMQQGKSAAESLGNALSKVGQQMTQVGSKSLVDSLLGGLKGGSLSFDPVSLGIGAAGGLLSLVGGLFDDKSKKAHDEAIDAWHKMATEFNRLVADLSGLKVGSLQQAFDDAQAKAGSLWVAARTAGDTAAMQQISEALGKFQAVEAQKFVNAFEGTIASLNSGLGPDSPFAEGAARVKQFSDAVQGFLSDTIMITGGGSDASRRAADASAKYLLSLLQIEPALSDTQKQLQSMQGIASQLQAALQALGMSADDAAAAINQNLATAIDALRTQFVDTLTRDINTATGKGFLNDIGDLVTKFQQMQADASALGADPSLLTRWFDVSAQKIVDDAQLTGQAFDDLIVAFPQLQGAVTAFSAAVTRSAQEIASTQQSFQDQLFTLGQDQTTLSGQLAVFDLQAQRAREDEIAKGGQALVDLEALQAAQRFDIIKKYNDQAVEDTKRALEEAQNFVDGVTRKIKEYLNSLNTSSSSPLSPAARFSAAQSAYNTQLSLASNAGSGQRDALDSITQYAGDLLEAAKALYGSSAGFQTVFSQVQSQLGGLTTQISPEQFIVNAITAQTTSLSTILQSGNPAAIAAALLPHFNTLDSNVNGLLDENEFVDGLHGMASDTQLKTMFKTLDTDNSGSLSRLELIEDAANDTKTSVDSTRTSVNNTKTAVDLAKAAIDSNTSVANQIRALTDTMINGSQALYGIYYNTSGTGTWLGLIAARLEYIHYNTAEANTANGIPHQSRGGLVRGPGTGMSDSIFAGGAWVSNGEYVVNAADTARNIGALDAINDNHAVIGSAPVMVGYPVATGSPGLSSEVVDELRREIAELKKILMLGFNGLATVSSEGAEAIATRLDRANDIAGDVNKRLRIRNANAA